MSEVVRCYEPTGVPVDAVTGRVWRPGDKAQAIGPVMRVREPLWERVTIPYAEAEALVAEMDITPGSPIPWRP